MNLSFLSFLLGVPLCYFLWRALRRMHIPYLARSVRCGLLPPNLHLLPSVGFSYLPFLGLTTSSTASSR